jgi:hypothetical protein
MNKQQIWDLWMPDAGAQGLLFARGRLDTTDTLIVHAAPEKLNVEVCDDEGVLLVKGANLRRTADTPMARSSSMRSAFRLRWGCSIRSSVSCSVRSLRRQRWQTVR